MIVHVVHFEFHLCAIMREIKFMFLDFSFINQMNFNSNEISEREQVVVIRGQGD